MDSSPPKPAVIDVQARVRANTGSAALTGALLVVFGFFWFGGAVVGETGLLATGKDLLLYTLRLGGLLMIAIAVWCSIGIPIALLFDGVICAVIGVFIVIGAVLMMIGGGVVLGPALCVVCGVTIITTGVRDWVDYCQLPSDVEETDAQGDSVDASVDFDEPLPDSGFPFSPPGAVDAGGGTKVRDSGARPGTSGSHLKRISKTDGQTRP